jgi:hypothetical protein
MKRYYNQKLLKEHFGYERSLYERHYNEKQEIAPNIGVLTVCKVKVGSTFHEAKIYHAIGAALDSHAQPDYQVFVANNFKKDRLIRFYVSVFEKIFVAAEMCKAKGVVMSLVGGKAFANLYPTGVNGMHTEVWIPAFQSVWERHKGTNLAATGDLKPPAGQYLLNKINATNAGMFPALVPKFKNWMIVNAWDCHTLPGNGNALDPTIDGHIGRASAIHYFGWGIANPLLLENTVEVNVPKKT